MIHYEIKTDDVQGEISVPLGKLIYSSFRIGEGYAAQNVKFKDELNKVPTLSFDLLSSNPAAGTLKLRSSKIYFMQNGEMIFRGEITNIKRNFQNVYSYTAEGDIAFLHDVLVRPYPDMDMTEADYFRWFFVSGYVGGIPAYAKYNSKASADRQFELGINQGSTAPNAVRLFENDSYPDCYDELTQNLDIYNGGFLRTRHEKIGGVWHNYIDYIKSPPTGAQKIQYAKNLLDLTDEEDGRQLCTRYIPVGATVEKHRTVLTGDDFIPANVSEYGVIEQKADYSDVDTPSELRTQATNDFSAMGLSVKKTTIKVKAVDLTIIGDSDEPLQVGYLYHVFSYPHGLDELDAPVQLQRAEIDPNNPDKCFYWFGDVPHDSMRRIQADRRRAEETRQRVLQESTYTSSNGVETGSGGSVTGTYSVQSATSSSGGKDIATASGTYTANLSGWTKVDLFKKTDGKIELPIADGTSLTIGAGTTAKIASGTTLTIDDDEYEVSNGTLKLSSGTLKLSSGTLKLTDMPTLIYKATGTVSLTSRPISSAAVVIMPIGEENVISIQATGVSGTTVNVVAYALATGFSRNDPTGLPSSVSVAMMAVGIDGAGT